jgi:anti-anti-sigma factor
MTAPDDSSRASQQTIPGVGLLRDVRVVYPGKGQAVVELSGEHVFETREQVHELLVSLVRTSDLVVVDVSEAKFVDSSFLRNLSIADRIAREQGSRLRLQLGTAPVVRRALEISGMLDFLDCVSDRRAALQPPDVPTLDARPPGDRRAASALPTARPVGPQSNQGA